VTRGGEELHSQEHHKCYSSLDIVTMIRPRRLAEQLARMGEKRSACDDPVGKSEGSRPLGRPRRKWEDNINGNGS
jgi:hypothetical protein